MSFRRDGAWINFLLTRGGERLVYATLRGGGQSWVEGLLAAFSRYRAEYGVPPLHGSARFDVRARLIETSEPWSPPPWPWLTAPNLLPPTAFGGPRNRHLGLYVRDGGDHARLVALLAGAGAPSPVLLGRALTAMCLAVVFLDEDLLRCWDTRWLDALYEETYGSDEDRSVAVRLAPVPHPQ